MHLTFGHKARIIGPFMTTSKMCHFFECLSVKELNVSRAHFPPESYDGKVFAKESAAGNYGKTHKVSRALSQVEAPKNKSYLSIKLP